MRPIAPISVLLLLLLLLVFEGQVSWAGRPSVSYVHRPEDRDYDPPALEWVRQQVALLPESSRPEEIREYLEETRRGIKERKQLPAPFKGQRVVLNDLLYHLVHLTERDSECTFIMVSYYIKMIQRVFGSLEVISQSSGPSHDGNLFNFLQHYGRIRFKGCASKLEHQVDMITVEKLAPGVERALDDLVGSQDSKENRKLNSAPDDHDKHLAELASRVDFVTGDFNAKKMLKVARCHRKSSPKPKHGHHHHHHHHPSPASLLIDFIGLQCHGLLFDFEHLLNVVSINNLLNEPSNTPERLVKLIEYGRMCHQFEESDTSEQLIHRKLANAISKMADFACCRLGLHQTVDESD